MKLKQKLAITYIKTKLKLLSIISKRKAAEKAFELFCTPFARVTNRPSAIFEAAELVTFTVNNTKIQGYRWNKDQPNKVLILHGFGSAAQNFGHYVTALVDKNYQVLAFDAPAHGNSEGSTINAMQYSQVIEEVNNLYGPINGFLAHSLGGLALSLAMENIPTTESTKVVFIAPATETVTAIDEAFKFLHIDDKGIRQEFDAIIQEISGHSTDWFSIKRAIKNNKASILWVHDEDDDITPIKDALAVKETGQKNIRFIITKGLGHRKIYRDIAIQKEVLQFL